MRATRPLTGVWRNFGLSEPPQCPELVRQSSRKVGTARSTKCVILQDSLPDVLDLADHMFDGELGGAGRSALADPGALGWALKQARNGIAQLRDVTDREAEPACSMLHQHVRAIRVAGHHSFASCHGLCHS